MVSEEEGSGTVNTLGNHWLRSLFPLITSRGRDLLQKGRGRKEEGKKLID